MSVTSVEFTIYLALTLAIGLVAHEYARAFAATRLGDLTPKLSGRLSWNFRRHIDPFGSLLLPAILLLPVLFGRSAVFPVFAYAKPLPMNPWTLRRRDRDVVLISLAGPAANLVLAFAFGAAFRVATAGQLLTGAEHPSQLALFLGAGVVTNVVMTVMNLVPVPGLDGSRIVARFLPDRAREIYTSLDPYCALFILVVVFIFQGPVVAFVRLIGNGICSLAAGAPSCV
jgi:Zn-dependent protease